ncbi:transposase [Streptomyces sp. NPDC002676]
MGRHSRCVGRRTTTGAPQRQYSGTADRTEDCRIGVFAAYATIRGRAPVERELYLPKSWTNDRRRCRAAKIPDERTFATKGELATVTVLRALASPLPIAWVTADSAYGQERRFRRLLEETAIGYVLAVPKPQQVPRFGRMPACLPLGSRPDPRDRGLGRRQTHTSTLGAGPRRSAIEECFQAAKNECGLDQYEVRRPLATCPSPQPPAPSPSPPTATTDDVSTR